MKTVKTTFHHNRLKSIINSAVIVGVLDGVAAVVMNLISGKKPLIVFQYIASGLFGKAAYDDAFFYILVGLIIHFSIALFFSTLFFSLFRFINISSVNKFLIGALYGIFVWFIMYLGVIPFFGLQSAPSTLERAIAGITIHVFFVGIPIAVIYYSSQSFLLAKRKKKVFLK